MSMGDRRIGEFRFQRPIVDFDGRSSIRRSALSNRKSVDRRSAIANRH